MADIPVSRTPILETKPTTEEGFYADRRKFWGSFTGMVTTAVVVVAAVLIGMVIFLV